MYRALWRLHFYAGIFCIPFILWMCVTGTIYLFKPQIDGLFDLPYAHLLPDGGTRALASVEAKAALAAVPGGSLNAYQLPANPQAAAQVLVSQGSRLIRVYVDPRNAHVLKTIPDGSQFESRISSLHGELLLGNAGSNVIELLASWAIVMIFTGLYLWYPRDGSGFASMLWPRRARGRALARELHGVAGSWVSLIALFFLISGLPWTSSWGGLLKSVQNAFAHRTVAHDWTTGSTSALAKRTSEDAADASMAGMPGMADDTNGRSSVASLDTLDTLVSPVRDLHLPYPVLVVPPSPDKPRWTARSDTQDRPLRVTLMLDPTTGAVLTRKGFAALSPIDKIVAIGVASHEGQLFAPINQALSLVAVTLLLTLASSALIMWWSRRPSGVLGAPRAAEPPRYPALLIFATCALGVMLPLFGLSLITVLLAERLVLRRIAPVRDFLGLRYQ